MTQEQQNKSIAAYCGWRQSTSSMWEGWWHQKGKKTYQRFCPDYCNDLNAMHEAEKHLTTNEYMRYWDYLYNLCDRTVSSRVEDDFKLLHLTAAEKAEAFLKTIGKWDDEQ